MTLSIINGGKIKHPRPVRTDHPGGIISYAFPAVAIDGERFPELRIIDQARVRRYWIACPAADDNGPGLRVRDGAFNDVTGNVPARIAYDPARVVAWLVAGLALALEGIAS